MTGKLKRTSLLCDVHRVAADMGPGDEFQGEFMGSAQISDDGRVVHVNGDRREDAKGTYWAGDSLYFVKTGEVRHVKGWGSMTRDGGTILLRVGVRSLGAKDRTGGKVGAYNVKTGKVTKLAGKAKIYDTDAFTFSAVDQASRRGRFVVNDRVVVDRKYGLSVDVTALIRARGYQISGDLNCWTISGDGQVIFAPVVVDQERSAWVAVTGATAGARAAARGRGQVPTHHRRRSEQGGGLLDVLGAGPTSRWHLVASELLPHEGPHGDPHIRPAGGHLPSHSGSQVRIPECDVECGDAGRVGHTLVEGAPSRSRSERAGRASKPRHIPLNSDEAVVSRRRCAAPQPP